MSDYVFTLQLDLKKKGVMKRFPEMSLMGQCSTDSVIGPLTRTQTFKKHHLHSRHPLLSDLHWLPVIARINFKTLVLSYQAVKGSAPAYIQQLIRPTHPPDLSAPLPLDVPPPPKQPVYAGPGAPWENG